MVNALHLRRDATRKVCYTPRRLRGGVGVFRPHRRWGRKTPGGWRTLVNFGGNCCTNDNRSFTDAPHPPGASPADFVVGECSDPPPASGGG